MEIKGIHTLGALGDHTRLADVEVGDRTTMKKGHHTLGTEGDHTQFAKVEVGNNTTRYYDDDHKKTDVLEDSTTMGDISHEQLSNFDGFEDDNDEKNTEAPDAEGGHALLKPHTYLGGGDKMVTRFKRRAQEQSAVEMYYYVKSAMGEHDKTNRNKKLPRHRALKPSRCPEDWMGEVIVEYPVVFPRSNPTRYGNRNEVAQAKL